ncbi:double-stranded DNA-dependent ATPase PWA37_005136 [Arxiozyma heterogenica]|uniref:double-stranded DNA-dependent ATPase n=1 Tax=Arxiozyma heterogenica TaxID=278026 RepID=UPI002F10771F
MLQRFGSLFKKPSFLDIKWFIQCKTFQHLSLNKVKCYNESNRNTLNFRLRDYQREAVNTCVKYVTSGHVKRIGVSLATGGGKTVIFSHLIDKLNQMKLKQKSNDQTFRRFKTLILVHRRELAFQALNTIRHFNPTTNVQLEMSQHHANVGEADTIIASVLSLVQRLDKYDPNNIDLIIVDEAHHIVADTYMKILKHFHAANEKSRIPVIGFSATFERADKKALSQALDEIVYHKGVMEMIDEKWLCEGRFTNVKISINLDNVKKNNSDFVLKSLSSVVNTPETNDIIIETYLRMRLQHNIKSTLVFGVDKNHVKTLNKVFLQRGVKSDYITSDTKSLDRDNIMKAFKNGECEVLINCGILTEGTDIPNIDCILLCRPTCSRPLLIQMIGRGLRLHKGKKHCHIVDFVNASNVGVISIPTLFGITEANVPINDMTISQMESLKKSIEARKIEAKRCQEAEQAAKQLEEMKKEDLKQITLLKEYQKYIKSANVTLLSYDSFKDYYLGKHKNIFDKILRKNHKSGFNFEQESQFFEKCKYQWTQINSDSWALPLQHRYLRIDRTKNPQHYILKIYTKIPSGVNNDISKWFSKGKPFISNLPTILKEVEEIVTSVQRQHSRFDTRFKRRIPYIDYSKNSRWRRQPATSKQLTYLRKKFNEVYRKHKSEFPQLDQSLIDSYLKKLLRGAAADLTFATTIAPIYPVKSLLKLINFGTTMKTDQFT